MGIAILVVFALCIAGAVVWFFLKNKKTSQEEVINKPSEPVSEPEPTTEPQEDEKPVDEPEQPTDEEYFESIVGKHKFKTGYWIVDNEDDRVLQIVSMDDVGYQTQDGAFISYKEEKYFHLWTIQDAKAGDVLVCKKNEKPFIFKGFLDKFHPENPVAYCGIGTDGVLIVNTGDGWWTNDKVQPATKEQCDLLFQWIKEAGYEWDAEKKGLKRIEQKPAEWHREDDKRCHRGHSPYRCRRLSLYPTNGTL